MIQLESSFEYALDKENSCQRFAGNALLGLLCKTSLVVNNRGTVTGVEQVYCKKIFKMGLMLNFKMVNMSLVGLL